MNDTNPAPSEIDSAFLRFRDHGDVAALDRVFETAAPELFGLARHLVRDVHDAEDMLQATFVSAIDSAASFDAEARVMPWLVGILTNHVRNHRRKVRKLPREAGDEIEAVVGTANEPSAKANARELRSVLDKAMRALAQPYREVVELTVHGGLLAKEIAERLRRPAGTVRSQVTRGMEMLRRALPAGAAPAVLAVDTGRGLDAVQAEVHAHATEAVRRAATVTARTAASATPAKSGALIGIGAAAIVCVSVFVAGLAGAFASPEEDPRAPGVVAANARPAGTAGDDAGRSAADEGAARTHVAVPATRDAGDATSPQLTGRCVDEDGSPIPGVDVVALHRVDREQPLARIPYGTTDREGCFTIDLDAADAVPERLALESAEYVHAIVDPMNRGDGRKLGDIVLPRGALLCGHLADNTTGDRVEGERNIMWIRDTSAPMTQTGSIELNPIHSVRTTVDGAYVATARLAAGSYRVRVQGVQKVVTRTISIPSDPSTFDARIDVEQFFAMPPIRGIVVDEHGRGIPDARVDGDPTLVESGRDFASVRTDDSGRFTITHGDAQAEYVRIVAFAPGYTMTAQRRAKWGSSDVRITLVRPQYVELRVEDRDTGAAIPSFDVRVVHPGTVPVVSVDGEPAGESHHDGRAEMRAGYLPCRFVITPPSSHSPNFVDLEAVPGGPVTILVSQRERCEVVVESEAGTPMPNVEVTALRVIGRGRAGHDHAHSWSYASQLSDAVAIEGSQRTDATGAAVLQAPASEPLHLAVRGDGFGELIVRDVQLSSHEPIRVVVPRGARLCGTFTGEVFLRRLREPVNRGSMFAIPLESNQEWVTNARAIWTPAHVTELDWRTKFPAANVGADGSFELDIPAGQTGRIWMRQSYRSASISTSLPAQLVTTLPALRRGDTEQLEVDVSPFATAAIRARVPELDSKVPNDSFHVTATTGYAGNSGVALRGGEGLIVVLPDTVVGEFKVEHRVTERRGNGTSSWNIGEVRVAVPNIALRPGELRTVDLAVEFAGFDVTIESRSGAKVANRTVRAHTSGDALGLWIRTDARGHGEVHYFTPGPVRFVLEDPYGEDVELGTVQVAKNAPNSFRFVVD